MLKWSHVPWKLEVGCQSVSDTMVCDNKSPTVLDRSYGAYRLTLGIVLRLPAYLYQFLESLQVKARVKLGVWERDTLKIIKTTDLTVLQCEGSYIQVRSYLYRRVFFTLYSLLFFSFVKTKYLLILENCFLWMKLFTLGLICCDLRKFEIPVMDQLSLSKGCICQVMIEVVNQYSWIWNFLWWSK